MTATPSSGVKCVTTSLAGRQRDEAALRILALGSCGTSGQIVGNGAEGGDVHGYEDIEEVQIAAAAPGIGEWFPAAAELTYYFQPC
jgi:hypothetical protein